jgi:hypothetical protein
MLHPVFAPTYKSGGQAVFKCPELIKLQRAGVDGDGHMQWTFVWDKGSHSLDHPANGGIPKCGKCGLELLLVS